MLGEEKAIKSGSPEVWSTRHSFKCSTSSCCIMCGVVGEGGATRKPGGDSGSVLGSMKVEQKGQSCSNTRRQT